MALNLFGAITREVQLIRSHIAFISWQLFTFTQDHLRLSQPQQESSLLPIDSSIVNRVPPSVVHLSCLVSLVSLTSFFSFFFSFSGVWMDVILVLLSLSTWGMCMDSSLADSSFSFSSNTTSANVVPPSALHTVSIVLASSWCMLLLLISCRFMLMASSLRISGRDRMPCTFRSLLTFLYLLMDLSDFPWQYDVYVHFPNLSDAEDCFQNVKLKNLIADSSTSSGELSCMPLSVLLPSKTSLFWMCLSASAGQRVSQSCD